MSDMRMPDRTEEAARWFAARRRGVMTVEERDRYETWARDAVNVSAMARLERTWAAVGVAEGQLHKAVRRPAPAAVANGPFRAARRHVRRIARDRCFVL